MEADSIDDSSNIMNQSISSRSTSKAFFIREEEEISRSSQTNSFGLKSSMKALLSKSTFDDQASFVYNNAHNYLFDIELSLANGILQTESCHLIVFVHGLLGNINVVSTRRIFI